MAWTAECMVMLFTVREHRRRKRSEKFLTLSMKDQWVICKKKIQEADGYILDRDRNSWITNTGGNEIS